MAQEFQDGQWASVFVTPEQHGRHLRTGMPSQSKLITKLELDDWHAIATRAPLAHRRFYRRDRKRPSEKARREFGRDFPDDQL
jgi:hypothetical protein